jgi:hypothetical protein
LRRCGLIVLAVVLGSLAAEEPAIEAAPPSREPPELRKTVDAIAGRWSGTMTATTPEGTESFGWSIECRPVALGAGAACAMEGTASIGPLAQSCLLAYDPVGKAVHLMCVTSMGEVHDHRGHWRDERRLEFEPLRSGLMGKAMAETIAWEFPDAMTLLTRSAVATDDGTSMRFAFVGRRD